MEEASALDLSFLSFLGEKEQLLELYEDCLRALPNVPVKLKELLATFNFKIVLVKSIKEAFDATGDPVLNIPIEYTYCEYSSPSRKLYLADGPEHPSGFGRTTYYDVKTGLISAYDSLSGESAKPDLLQDLEDDFKNMDPDVASRYLINLTARDPATRFCSLGYHYLYRNESKQSMYAFVDEREAFPKAMKFVQQVLRKFEA